MKHVIAAMGALGTVLVGCGSSAPTALPMHIQSDASGTFLGGSDASTSGLSVAIRPVAPSVCPGACVDLTAAASGGRAPYAFAWSPAAASDGETITVCPSQTTTYTVNATDSSGGGGEVQRASLSGSANVTVTVDASCSEGGAPMDASRAAAADAGAIDGSASIDTGTRCTDAMGVPIDPYADSVVCASPDLTAVPFFFRIPLAKPFVRGQTYDVTITVSTTEASGPAPGVDVWASSSSDMCQPGQPLTNQALGALPIVGGTVTVHVCETAQIDAPALLAGFVFGLQGGVSAVSVSACPVAACAGNP
jgi:hypothetical protein